LLEHTIVWGLTPNGAFLVKSVTKVARQVEVLHARGQASPSWEFDKRPDRLWLATALQVLKTFAAICVEMHSQCA